MRVISFQSPINPVSNEEDTQYRKKESDYHKYKYTLADNRQRSIIHFKGREALPNCLQPPSKCTNQPGPSLSPRNAATNSTLPPVNDDDDDDEDAPRLFSTHRDANQQQRRSGQTETAFTREDDETGEGEEDGRGAGASKIRCFKPCPVAANKDPGSVPPLGVGTGRIIRIGGPARLLWP